MVFDGEKIGALFSVESDFFRLKSASRRMQQQLDFNVVDVRQFMIEVNRSGDEKICVFRLIKLRTKFETCML